MKKILLAVYILVALSGCATAEFRESDYARSAQIVSTEPQSGRNTTDALGLGPMRAQIPAYDGRGQLIASWTPQARPGQAPTFVIMHGGHGIGGTDFVMAQRLRTEFNANVLVLDSYWSRGRSQNWNRDASIDANVRTFDAIAAGRWLVQQGTDPNRTYMIGGSQGGWVVLRAFTNDPTIANLVKPLYRGGISLYPVCDTGPDLAPYHGPVLLLTGGRDETTPIYRCPRRVTASAHRWVHYPEGTHAWDIAVNGPLSPSVDGQCARSANPAAFRMCYSERITNAMYQEIRNFVQ